MGKKKCCCREKKKNKRRSLRSDISRVSVKLNCVMEKLLEMEVNIMVTQEQLDALVARIDTAVSNIRQDIQDVKDAHPDLDLSALESSVGGLEGLDAENPVPAPPVEPTE